ncbi:AAA family ATPase [Streptosporangium subroseum]|uniref:AAA family ATPase n=1 Tax=Streptosporangium subroseum TaxID=106412 RepID=UPI00341EEC7D
MSASLHLRPAGNHDLRGHHLPELRYPHNCVLVVAGIPGAGKTTLLRRLFVVTGQESTAARTSGRARVLDSAQARAWWRPYLNRLPYPWWRLLVHITHHLRLVIAIRTHSGPVAVHDCATRVWSRRLIVNAARRSGKQVHLLMLDVPPNIARAAQYARGRKVSAARFARHCRRWQHLREAALGGPNIVQRHITSTVLIDRATAQRLAAIHFEDAP